MSAAKDDSLQSTTPLPATATQSDSRDGGGSSTSGEGESGKRYERPDAWTTLRSFSPWQEFERMKSGKIPCFRGSLLLGMGTGAAALAVGVVARRSVRSSANWGVAAFLGVSVATHVTCRQSRKAEARRIKVIVEEYNRKREPISVGDR